MSSSQANNTQLNNADAHSQGLDGGLNLKTDAGRLSPPATTRADNGWYDNPGNIGQLPGFASAMQVSTSHVYNVHARDLQQPSTIGDVMLHGEVRDNFAVQPNRFTSPVWSDGYGTTFNQQQPVLPVNLRTRVLTGRLSIAGAATTDLANMMIASQSSGYTVGQQRYALAYHDGTNLNVTFGLAEGQIETGETLTVAAAADYAEIAQVQGTNYWVHAFIKGSTLTYKCYDFFGIVTGPTQTLTSVLAFNSAASGFYAPFTIVQHAGRTFIAYVTNPSGASCVFTMVDILSAISSTYGVSAANVPTAGFAVTSPYPNTAVTGSIFFGLLFANQAYIISQTTGLNGSAAGGQVSGGGIAIAQAAKTGYDSSQTPTGTVNFTATAAMCVFDTGNGTGTGASLGLTIFRHYPEQVSQTGVGTLWYQAVSVDRYQFAANATTATGVGTLTAIGQNIFRTPSGAQLCSKAFVLNDGTTNAAGLSGAKNAFALVRCGASEPLVNFSGNYSGNPLQNYWTYGQPTYFIIDHQARVVSRMFESAAPPACGYNLSNNTIYRTQTSTAWGTAAQVLSLSTPLVSAPNSDTSSLDITMPAWVQTNASTQVAYVASGVTYYTGQPANIIMQPTAITLSLSNQAAGCPPVQAGPYTIFSGAMTCVHDGRGVVEANYHFATHNPIVQATTTTTSPGAGGSGLYYWSVVWEWYDSFGRVHRSIPSTPFPANVPSGSFLASAMIYVPQPVTAKTAVGGVMYARLYRSVVNNTSGIFYLVSTTAISALSGTNYYAALSDSGAYLDASSTPVTTSGQQALTVQPRRYIDQAGSTSALVYQSMPPPAFIWQVGTKGRAFGLAQVLGQHRLYYSSVQQAQFPFEWNLSNYAAVPPDIGDVRSIEAIDDKILFFGTRSNAVMSGDGPAGSSSSGVPTPNDGFSLIQPIPTPVGIVGSGAPTRIPDGIVFQGFSGIQLIGRDLTVQPIGAAVDAITGRQVGNMGTVYGKGCTLASIQSVVWCSPQGPSLVYNYLTQKWSTWPLLANACAITQRLDGTIYVGLQPVIAGRYAGLATSSTIGADFGTLGLTTYSPIYQGNMSQPALVIETPWILPPGVSGGEAQIWDCTVTGSYLGPHILKVEQAYDYNNAYVSTQTFNWPSAPLNYQQRVRPTGKSSRIAVRYRVSLLPLTTLNAGYLMGTLGDLVLNYGTKQGTSRLGAPYSG